MHLAITTEECKQFSLDLKRKEESNNKRGDLPSWWKLTIEQRIECLTSLHFHVEDGFVYGGKMVSKEKSTSMFDGVCYDKLGVYLTNEPFDEIYNDDDHTPGLWAYSTQEVWHQAKGQSSIEQKIIYVCYFLDDVILTSNRALKARSFQVVNLNPQGGF